MRSEQALKQGGIASFFIGLFSLGKRRPVPAPPPAAPKPRGMVGDMEGYTAAQQQELEYLCAQLFKKKSLVTTGKLQLIGLEKVRRKLGPRWEAEKVFVYKVAKDVINEYIKDGDIFVRMKDDTYLIIFSNSTVEQGNATAAAIAEEIRTRLFASADAAMQSVTVRKCVVETRTKDFSTMPFTRALDYLVSRRSCVAETSAQPEKGQSVAPEAKPEPALIKIQIRYIPLWDHKKNAITSYYCSPLEGESFPPGAQGDMAVLHKVQQETARMVSDGRKFFIVCPVRHETLYKQESCAAYFKKCDAMTEEQRKMLVLVVTDVHEKWKKANGYWFAPELKKRCQHLLLEPSIGDSFDFTGLVRMGFDAVGLRIDNSGRSEKEVMDRLLVLRGKGQAASIAKAFVLGLDTLSMTTFAVCNGFDLVGGAAVHDPVSFPDGIHRYRYHDIISGTGTGDTFEK